jgi:putative oxidoreductase
MEVLGCWFLSAVFLVASTVKWLDLELFLQDLKSYQLVPLMLEPAMAVLVPFLELVAALLLLFPKPRIYGLGLISGLLLVFLMAILSAWLRGLDISCGCFGLTTGPVQYPWLFARDLGLLVCTIPGFYAYFGPKPSIS